MLQCGLNRIAEQHPTTHQNSFSFGQQNIEQTTPQQLEVRTLTNPALLSYLYGRGINTELAVKNCKEVRISNGHGKYFSIGFQNISGGFELRNKYFKGCTVPKDISIVGHGTVQSVFVFEGFMDYLSFLTLRLKNCPDNPNLEGQDYLILNSVSNLSKAMDRLGDYKEIHCFLDNDKAGVTALERIREEYGLRVCDSSRLYRGYKDVNDFLCGKKQF